MKNFLFFSAFSLALLSSAHSAFIDNGYASKKETLKSVVKLSTFDYNYRLENEQGICTATLIGPSTILTAAHCVNHDSEMRQRISLPGDNTGDSEREFFGLLSGGGIKIKKTFLPKQYKVEDEKLEALHKELMGFVVLVDRPLIDATLSNLRAAIKAQDLKVSEYDIAIMTLEKPVTLKEFPALGCDLLPDNTPVMLAGYGKDMGIHGNENPDYKMNYGYNNAFTTANGIYEIFYQEGMQLSNKGDSGGPLFKRNNQKVVYGAVSRGGSDSYGRTLSVQYASTSSKAAKGFYKSLNQMKNVPAEVKQIIKKCL